MKDNKDNKASVEQDGGISPILSAMRSEKKSFDVPDGYFEKMEDQIIQKIQSKENKRSRSIFEIFRQPRIAVPIGIAFAAIALLLLINKPAEEKLMGVPQLSQDELINTNLYFDLDEDILLETYFLENQNQVAETDEKELFNIEAEQYLIDHKIDVNLIMNEL